MRGRKIVVAAALGLVALAGVTGCSSSGSGGSSSTESGGRPQSAPAAKGSESSGGSADEAAKAQGPMSADQRKVIRSAQLSIRAEDVAAAARAVTEVGPRFGGYVADEEAETSRATVQLKVESAKLDDALTVLSGVGQVTSRSQQATDVTEQSVDLQARIAAQRASVDRVRTLLANATTIGEIVQIESELTTRQAELDSLEQRLAALNGKADLADITVSIYLSSSPIVTDDDDDTGFLPGLAAGWGAFVDAVQIGLTVFGALLPFLVALAIPVTIVVWLIRRNRKAAPKLATANATAGPAGPPPSS